MAYSKHPRTLIFFLIMHPAIAIGAQFPFESLPRDVQSIIHGYFIPEKEVRYIKNLQHSQLPQKEIDSIMNDHLNRIIKDVRSFLLTQKKYYFSVTLNNFFIKKIAHIYFQDPIEVAIRLNTAGSFNWLKSYIVANIRNMNRAIILFLNAASDANVCIFMMLAKAEVPANAADRNGNTALMLALQSNDQEKSAKQKLIIEWLINHGAAINQRDKNGSFPLLDASRLNNTNIFKLLLTHGANPNVQGGLEQSTPLHWAVSYGNQEEIELLLAHGLNKKMINMQNRMGNTPLRIARNKRLKAIEELLKRHGAKQ